MPDDIVVFLTRVRELIDLEKRRFVARNYHGRTYKEVLFNDFGIGVSSAWDIIYSLTKHNYVIDEKPNYFNQSDAYVFKRIVNGQMAYIKICIENIEDEMVVCISFHLD